jgi:hypothetical protein
MSVAETYIPDQLIAGALHLVTANAVITGGALLQRGTVLGVTTWVSGNMAPAVGNKGNGTLTDISFGKGSKPGAYKVVFTGPQDFKVFDPDAVELKPGLVHGDYESSEEKPTEHADKPAAEGRHPARRGAHAEAGATGATGAIGANGHASPPVHFKFNAGTTPMQEGDSINVTAGTAVGKYKKSVSTAVDGSQTPCGILVDQADASAADVNGGVYIMGEFNANAIIYDPSWTLLTLVPALQAHNIYIKGSTVATDPT